MLISLGDCIMAPGNLWICPVFGCLQQWQVGELLGCCFTQTGLANLKGAYDSCTTRFFHMNAKLTSSCLGLVLWKHRLEKDFSQAEVARAALISREALGRIESGGGSRTETFLRVAEVLGLDYGRVFEEATALANMEVAERATATAKLLGKRVKTSTPHKSFL